MKQTQYIINFLIFWGKNFAKGWKLDLRIDFLEMQKPKARKDFFN